MFNKKEFTLLQAHLKSLEEKHDMRFTTLQTAHQQTLQTLERKFQELKDKQYYYFDEFERNLAMIRELTLGYQKSIDELNLVKNTLSEKILSKLEKDLRAEVEKHLSTLTNEKNQLQDFRDTLASLRVEVQRLTILSQHIKETDYTLVNTLQKLQDETQEKTRLLHQVDSLQSLIGRIRQGKHG